MTNREHLREAVRTILIAGGVIIVLAVGAILGGQNLVWAGLALLATLSMLFPEIGLALFVNAGLFKGDPRLEFPDWFDLTVFFAIVSTVSIIVNAARRKIPLSRPPLLLILPYGVMALLAAISVTYTPVPIYGEEKLLRFLTLTTFALFGPWFVLVSRERIQRFFLVIVLLSSLIVVDSTFIEGLEPGEVGFQAFSSGYLGMGRIAGEAVLILFFYFLLKATSYPQRALIMAALALNAFGVIVAALKSAVIALGLTLVGVTGYSLANVIALPLFRQRVPRKYFKPLVAFGMLGAIIVVLAAAQGKYFLTLMARLPEILPGATWGQSDRVEYYDKAIDAMTTFPTAITGLGIGGFGKSYYGFDVTRVFAHNIFLEVGSELGLIGLGAFLLLIYGGLKAAFRPLHDREGWVYFMGGTFLALVIYLCIHFCFHGDINDARCLFAWIGGSFAYGQYVGGKSQNHESRKQSRFPLVSPSHAVRNQGLLQGSKDSLIRRVPGSPHRST